MGNMIELTYNNQQFSAYLAKPQGEVKGGLIVIHEVWGLVEHTKSIADRFAKEGFLVLAPSLLSELGITDKLAGDLQSKLFNPKTRSETQPKLRALMTPMQAPEFGQKTIGRVLECYRFLVDQKEINQNVGVTGFCFGGTYCYSLAVNQPNLKFAVPFYGHANFSADELSKIKCPILAFYGENDEGLMTELPDLKTQMKQAGVDFTAKVYKDCGHAFFNDTNSFAYNEAAATDAWKMTLAFMNNHI
ncbi:MAG TPA: dienelactone hydrolase family protein [Candidatus Saccharimonadia bacterium]|nr:dienelactone hydrolase family protein [Candidatus Saccharimonadia bacterium]